MGKYSALYSDIFSIFGSSQWQLENIKTFPEDFVGDVVGEYIRVSVIPSGSNLVNTPRSASGQIIIEIFTPAGNGPARTIAIADKLDSYLSGKFFSSNGNSTQFESSSLASRGFDTINKNLIVSHYSIPFKHFGVK